MLPVFVPTYIIPYWKTVSYCEVVSKDSLLIPGFWKIYLAQSSTDTSLVPPDSAVYYSDNLYPGIPRRRFSAGFKPSIRLGYLSFCFWDMRTRCHTGISPVEKMI